MLSPLLFNNILSVLADAIRQNIFSNLTPYRDQKGKSKTVITDDIILYIEKPKEYTHTCTHTQLELKNEFSKVAEHKIKI